MPGTGAAATAHTGRVALHPRGHGEGSRGREPHRGGHSPPSPLRQSCQDPGDGSAALSLGDGSFRQPCSQPGPPVLPTVPRGAAPAAQHPRKPDLLGSPDASPSSSCCQVRTNKLPSQTTAANAALPANPEWLFWRHGAPPVPSLSPPFLRPGGAGPRQRCQPEGAPRRGSSSSHPTGCQKRLAGDTCVIWGQKNGSR